MIYKDLKTATAALVNACPIAIQRVDVNVANHLTTIRDHGLGPADPRQDNTDFWRAKGQLWGVTEGDARGRMCCNCRHYYNTTQIKQCIDLTDTKNLKASNLPLDPPWADIESRPVGYCDLFDITCSPVRTCDAQEMGGPIDDERAQYLELPPLKPEE